jgi:hypothetical protein
MQHKNILSIMEPGKYPILKFVGMKKMTEFTRSNPHKSITLRSSGCSWYVSNVVYPEHYMYSLNDRKTVLFLVTNEMEGKALSNNFRDQQKLILIKKTDEKHANVKVYDHEITGFISNLTKIESEEQIEDICGSQLVYKTYYDLIRRQHTRSTHCTFYSFESRDTPKKVARRELFVESVLGGQPKADLSKELEEDIDSSPERKDELKPPARKKKDFVVEMAEMKHFVWKIILDVCLEEEDE